MRRSAMMLVAASLLLPLAGCGGGGIDEGMSTEKGEEGGAPPGFKSLMQKDADKMKIKGKPKTPPPTAEKKAG